MQSRTLVYLGLTIVALCLQFSESAPAANLKERKATAEKAAINCCAGRKLAETDPKKSQLDSKDKDKKQAGSDKKAEEITTAERKPVLDPSQFHGLAAFGYAAAKAAPEVMEKIFCYCGCDLTDNHLSLLDCFTSIHGVDCHICQEEALLAHKMSKDSTPIKEIQRIIDEKYASQYPFESDTPTYKKYKATRLYKPADSGTAPVTFGTQVAGPDAPDDQNANTKPKLKPGKEAGKCCSGGDHKDETGAAADSKTSEKSKTLEKPKTSEEPKTSKKSKSPKTTESEKKNKS